MIYIHIYVYVHNACVCVSQTEGYKERWENIEPWDSGPPNPQTNLGYPRVDWSPFRLIPIPMCLRFYEIRNSLNHPVQTCYCNLLKCPYFFKKKSPDLPCVCRNPLDFRALFHVLLRQRFSISWAVPVGDVLDEHTRLVGLMKFAETVSGMGLSTY